MKTKPKSNEDFVSLGSRIRFAATRWSVVLSAGNWRTNAESQQAMGELARLYWFPLYAYIRRRGYTAAQAEDLVQGFFARLLEKDALASVDRAKGKFRSFLLTSFENYLANEWDKRRAAKQDEGREILALDALNAETRYAMEPLDDMTPNRVFERRWAFAVLDQVRSRLRKDYIGRGQEEIYTALEHVLAGGEKAHYRSVAQRLNMTEATVKVAAHRLRRRFRELLRDEIAQTVSEPELVDDEIRHLLNCL